MTYNETGKRLLVSGNLHSTRHDMVWKIRMNPQKSGGKVNFTLGLLGGQN